MSAADKIRDMVVRGKVSATDDSNPIGLCQAKLFEGETEDEIERFESYGLSARPHVGAEALVAHLDGDRSHPIAMATPDRRYRVVNLAPGEVCLYDSRGRRVFLRRNSVEIEAVDAPVKVHTKGSVTIDAPSVRITGTLVVDRLITGKGGLAVSGGGGATVQGDVVADGISLKTHTHPCGDHSTGAPQ